MICTSCITKVSAAPTNNTKINSNEINISEDSSKSERIPSTKSKPLGLNATKANTAKYSFNDLNKLSNKEILDLTSRIKWNDISDLFSITMIVMLLFKQRTCTSSNRWIV
ncbi:hypothetical protein JTT01_09985 [Clostridium botulinum]|nr:hypothetical protein [Clostridium botulinum]